MKKIISMVVLITIFLMSSTVLSYAQEKQTKVIEEKSAVKTRGEAPVQITPKMTNTPGQPAKEDKSRGDVYPGYCDVVIDNWTGWYIDIYIDGSYRGQIKPWDKRVTWAIPGNTKLYAEAPGTSFYWGPRMVDCGYQHTWKLNP
ncbi:MAG: hypothetical protein JXA23_06040 [Bacteroidales bacterium]|nr:hypothetical protein [Bacteroidales bacterium]